MVSHGESAMIGQSVMYHLRQSGRRLSGSASLPAGGPITVFAYLERLPGEPPPRP